MADLLAELPCLECGSAESPCVSKLAESVVALTDRVAALEAARLAPKPRLVKTGVCRTGWRPGRQRFGLRPHNKIPGRLVEDSDEQQTINLILQARAEGMGPRPICQHLDRLGRKRRGKSWKGAHSLVAAVLKRAR